MRVGSIWPPIRFSFTGPSITTCRSSGRPSPPDRPSISSAPTIRGAMSQRGVIYGFRISVLFGLMLDHPVSSDHWRHAAGAVQGLLRRLDSICCSSVSSKSGPVMPTLYLLIILASSLIEPEFLDPGSLGIMLLFGWMALGWRRAGGVSARPQFRLCAGRRGRSVFRQCQDHGQACAAERHGRLADLHAVHPQRVRSPRLTSLDFLGFGLAAGLGRRLAKCWQQGKANIQAPVARHHGLRGAVACMLTLLMFIFEAVRDAFDPRKSLAADGPYSAMTKLLEVKDLSAAFAGEDGVTGRSPWCTKSPSTIDRRARSWRWSGKVRLGQIGLGACRCPRLLPYPAASPIRPAPGLVPTARRPVCKRRKIVLRQHPGQPTSR